MFLLFIFFSGNFVFHLPSVGKKGNMWYDHLYIQRNNMGSFTYYVITEGEGVRQ